MSQYVVDPTTGQIRLKTPQEVLNGESQIDSTTAGLIAGLEQTAPELAAVIRQNSQRGGATSPTTGTPGYQAPKSSDDIPGRKAEPIPSQTADPKQGRTQDTGALRESNQGNIQAIIDLLKPLADPKTVNELEDARLGRELQLADRYGQLARERDVEMQNIRSWQAIQQAQINRDAILAQSLATTSYLAMTPNANTLSALNVGKASASQAFRR